MLRNTLHPTVKQFYTSEDATLYLDYGGLDFIDGIFLHVDINTWSVSKYKLYLRIWERAKEKLYKEGYKYAYATAPPGQPEKLIKMFGLRDTGLLIKGLKLMRIELCQS